MMTTTMTIGQWVTSLLLINIGIFASSFALTMFLGFQSKNVNQSRMIAAFFTSIGISICNIITVKVAVSHDTFQIALMMFGSGLGIVTSILLHDRLTKRKK